MTYSNLCSSCTNIGCKYIGCKFQPSIRTKCAFYVPPHIEPVYCRNDEVMQPTAKATPTDPYEARLKADMLAILEELQFEIEEEKQDTAHLHYDDLENAERYNTGIDSCLDIIQAKVSKLKELKMTEIENYPLSKQEQSCSDAINREDALMCLTGEIKEADTIESVIARFARRIRKLPPVNTTKTGHWIFDDECNEHGHCSRCGYGSIDLLDGEPHDFCRKCGAWMVEPPESEGRNE